MTRFDTFLANVNTQIINPLIVFLFALALVYFLYGMTEFLWNGGNDEKKTIGKSHMLWGVVGLTIMVGVWAILNVILNTLGITGIKPESNEVTLPPYNPPSINR
jgi:succinate dehydrogenase/fumarate reductase cytochrome b subunit